VSGVNARTLRAEMTAWAAEALEHWLADPARVPNLPMQFRGKVSSFVVKAYLLCDGDSDPLMTVGVAIGLPGATEIALSRDGAPWKGFGS
jgi:hypothetical protein